MIISSQGEVCSPNDDIKALDLNGTNALRDRLLEIQLSTGSGEDALLAGAEIELEKEKQARQVSAEQEKVDKIEEAKRALQEFRDYLAQSSDQAAQALPSEEDLVYNYNPDTQECEITRQGGRVFELDLYGSNLQGELPLPPQLMVTRLLCQGNELTALPELPASLTTLICYRNQLTTLPKLPASLAQLYCEHNQLTKLPELPDSLTELYCEGNQLTTLPELPDNLTKLYCGRNKLTSLPILPANLSEIDCRNNQLTTLPELPASLFKLDCRDNRTLAEKPATKRTLKAMRERGGTVYS